ncbi:hypothetical protein CLAFUW4_01819 [Fulvia fulva]|uniref:uncharacterized protein n=1 Tax=Passalora fulva TaxID=5499 RepID=UPI002852ABA0|nr:uncharacterized protein CLAFUR5_20133 [Fulvia fulva]KAK4635655.1 hypothetical protein CLAFUR4_20115 [Fulvia fulva]KAK4637011.1 hypothetical protein CLAFUR0_01818 [Fulvia fulva]WMI38768.1 hypothetical protein CLAFUR5_20133 [Fulvia fulva]WPV08923.1 hypothetical protein CLAFUW4_01819 [Fulvia fulva]WPV25355.1 hypothetical protein CLAFUW7_01820 [Fulvia fulva]
MDDFQIFSKSEKRIDNLIAGLKKKYSIKTVDTNLFLGMYLKLNKKGDLLISQKHYALEKLQKHGLDQAKSVKYPLDRLYKKHTS